METTEKTAAQLQDELIQAVQPKQPEYTLLEVVVENASQEAYEVDANLFDATLEEGQAVPLERLTAMSENMARQLVELLTPTMARGGNFFLSIGKLTPRLVTADTPPGAHPFSRAGYIFKVTLHQKPGRATRRSRRGRK